MFWHAFLEALAQIAFLAAFFGIPCLLQALITRAIDRRKRRTGR